MNATRLLKSIGAVAVVAFLCGCSTVHPRYLAQPEPLAVRGTYVHPPSGIVMPESVAGFRRDMVLRYDTDSFDVSAGYNFLSAIQPIVATVYIYPAPSLVSIGSPPEVVADARAHLTEREFERRKQEIEHVHPGCVFIEQRDIMQIENGQSYPGKLAVFEYEGAFAGSRISLRSRLYVFCFVGGKWAIEYRFTCPKHADTDEKIQEFIQKWRWFGTGI